MVRQEAGKLLVTAAAHSASSSCESAVKRGTTQPIPSDLSDTIGNFKAHCTQGHLQRALHILHKLEEQGYQRSSYTYVCLLQGCIQSNALQEGKLLHDHIVKNGLKPNIFLSTTIANMYARCGSIEDARVVFDSMSERNLVTWSMMIDAYCKHEKFEEAFQVFWRMQKEGLTPDKVNFVSVLKVCVGLGSLQQGKKIHELLKRSEIKPNTMVENSLLNMYVKCGSMEDAQQVFDNMDERDAGSWTVMIAGHAKNGNAEEAMRLFWSMQSTDVEPDDVTFLSILNACAGLGDLKQAKQIHAYIKKSGVKLSSFMWNTLIDMYAKCGSLMDAWELFDEIPERDAVTWNAMIAGLTKHGHYEEALRLHGQMTTEGIHPDQVSFVSVLNACTALKDLEHGKRIHSQIAKTGAFLNIFVENALIDMYAKCGSLTIARQLFDQMWKRNVVSWNTMIVGYGKCGLDQDVLELFERMVAEGMKPDEVTYVSLLNACATMTALEQGLQVHHEILVSRYEFDVFVGNALIDMYAKCGRIKDAGKVWDRMSKRDVVSWNAMLAGYAQHGHGQEALQLADCMLREGVQLNHVSFVGILSACSHAGLVDEGRYYFSFMTWDHGVPQAIEHYGCMVDLLGRSGHLHEAEGLLKRMSLEASTVLWRALLGACRIHGNIDLATHAAEHVLDMDPHDGAVLLLLSNIHASADGWEDQATVITMMNDGDQEEDGFGSYDAYAGYE